MRPGQAAAFRLRVVYDAYSRLGKGFLEKLSSLPLDFAGAFARLFGHTLVCARQFEDWDRIARDLATICDLLL